MGMYRGLAAGTVPMPGTFCADGSRQEMFDRFPQRHGVQPLPETREPASAKRRSAQETRGRRTDGAKDYRPWLGGLAVTLLILFWLIRVGCIDMDSVRAGVLTRIAGIYPDQAEAYTFLSQHYDSVGRGGDAVEACEKLVQVKPEDPHTHVLLGEAYRDQNRFKEAIACYKEAVELDPNCFEAHFNLGRVCDRLGRSDDAVESYESAARIKPDEAPVYVALGLVLSNLGRYDEAMEAFKRARQIDPQIGESQVLSGKDHLEAGDYHGAVTCFKQAVLVDQGYAQAHFNLGRAYLKIGDKDLARRELRTLESLDSDLAERLERLIK